MRRPTHVLDASAILAVLLAEPGADVVRSAGPSGVVSAVNLSEVVAKSLDNGTPPALTRQVLDSLSFQVAAFGEPAAITAGELREQTRGRNISFGDRACLALGLELNVPVLTTDREWAKLGLPVDIRLIR